jgi:hypothetical protein
MEEPKSFISPAGAMQQGWPVVIEFTNILGLYPLV